jgi:hypothetical protein
MIKGTREFILNFSVRHKVEKQTDGTNLFSFIVIAFGIVRLCEDGLAAIESIGQRFFMGYIPKSTTI